jgi:hypothetical protein
MSERRRDNTYQFTHNDRYITENVRIQMTNDIMPDNTGTAGASSEIIIQKDKQITGERVKTGTVAAGAIMALQVLGIL